MGKALPAKVKEGGADDLVPAPDAEGQQRQVDGRRARGQGHGVRGAGVAADLLLEGLKGGAGGGDPVGAEGLVDEVELAPAHVGGARGRGGACRSW